MVHLGGNMIRRRLKTALLMALIALAALLLPPDLVSGVLSLPVQRALRRFSGRFSFPLAELMCLGALGVCAWCLLRALWRAKRTRFASMAEFTSGLAAFLSFLLMSYALLWAPVARAQSPAFASYDAPSLDALVSSLSSQAQALWTDQLPGGSQAASQAAQVLYQETGQRPVIKAARYPELMKLINLAGVCFPWSGEALVRSDLWGLSLPFVAAHEGAHQLGYGSEAQASYIAYRACLRGGKALRYSGTAYMLYYALDALAHADAGAYARAYERLDDRVRGDVHRIAASQASLSGPLFGAAQAFLRLTGQGGQSDYGQVVSYLLADQPST